MKIIRFINDLCNLTNTSTLASYGNPLKSHYRIESVSLDDWGAYECEGTFTDITPLTHKSNVAFLYVQGGY